MKKKVEKKEASNWFVIALSLVSIFGFLNILLESLFYFSISNYNEFSWLSILGLSLIFQTSIKELKKIKKKGLTSEYLGKITMIIIGTIAVIAGILSIPIIKIENITFMAIKGIISILAIIFIVLQTWVIKQK